MSKREEQPRRIRMDKWVPAEHAIYLAQQAIERMDADVRLTNAQTKLSEAQKLVADFVDGIPSPEEQPKEEEELKKSAFWISVATENDFGGDVRYKSDKYVTLSSALSVLQAKSTPSQSEIERKAMELRLKWLNHRP